MSSVQLLNSHLYLDFHSHLENENIDNIFRIHSYDISEYKKINTPFTIGLHPWFISNDSRSQISEIQEIAKEPNCVGIGEVGLDGTRGGDKKFQVELLEKLIEVSMKVNKPLIFHIVKAYDVFEELIKKYKNYIPWVIHGFSRNPKLAKSLIQKDIVLSFGFRVLESKDYEAFFSDIQPDSYFLETDNSEVKIELLYDKISKLTGLDIMEISSLQKKLYKKVFGSQIVYDF